MPDVREVDAGRRTAVVHQGAQGSGELGVAAGVGAVHLDGDEQMVGEAPVVDTGEICGRHSWEHREAHGVDTTAVSRRFAGILAAWTQRRSGRTSTPGVRDGAVSPTSCSSPRSRPSNLATPSTSVAVRAATPSGSPSAAGSVTAVDVSANALAAATEQARRAGVDSAIRWERHDLDETFPDGSFDLVVSCYLQSPVALERTAILRAAAAAVRPGGLLLVIGHAGPSHDGHHVDMPGAVEVLADLDLGDDWDVERCADVERPTRPDSVVRVRRATE